MTSEENKKPTSDPAIKIPAKIDFVFIHSQFSRVVHVDGAWGSITPQGNISMALFNERGSVPTKVQYTITDNKLAGEKASGSMPTREVEIEAVMSLEVAKSIHTWLGQKIEQVEGLVLTIENGTLRFLDRAIIESRSDIESLFESLVEKLHRDTDMSSNNRDVLSHTAYHDILRMPKDDVLPLIFKDWQDRGGYWHLALNTIVGQPFQITRDDSMATLKEKWMNWARDEGYLK